MNNHLYSLDYVILTLRLVIKHLDFNEEDIFRYGSDKDQPPLEALKDYITLILNKQKSEDSLPEFIFNFNHTPENIEKKLEITPNTLSKLSQEVMIHGCLLDKNNLKVLTAWTLLCNELYIPWTLLDNSTALSNIARAKSKTFSSFTEKNNFLRIFNDFLNALCALGYQQTVEAFHQFLYITHQVTLHNEENQTTPEGIAKIQSICFTNGLELEGVLGKIEPLEDNLHYTALLKQENMLFFEMVKYLANCDQFKKPFSIVDYKPNLSSQFNATFEQTIASIWAKPNIAIIPYSNDMFGEVSKPNLNPSLLPVIPDNSETAADDLRTRSQSPRSHLVTEKPERSKKSFELFRKKVAKSDEPIRTRKISTEKVSLSADRDVKSGLTRERANLTLSTPNLESKPLRPQAKTKELEPHSMLIDKDKKREPKSLPPRSTKQETTPNRQSKSSSPRKPEQEHLQKRESKSKPVLPLLQLTSPPENKSTESQSHFVYRSPKSLGSPKTHVSNIFNHSPQAITSSSCSSSYYSSDESSHEKNSTHSSHFIFSLDEMLEEKPKPQDIDELAKMLQDLQFEAEPKKSSSETTEENHYFHYKNKNSKEKGGLSASPTSHHGKQANEYVPLLSQSSQYTPSVVYKPKRSKDALQTQQSKSKLNNDQSQGSSLK